MTVVRRFQQCRVVDVACGDEHTVAILRSKEAARTGMNDGSPTSVVTFGCGAVGQLGRGGLTQVSYPGVVRGLEALIEYDQRTHTCARTHARTPTTLHIPLPYAPTTPQHDRIVSSTSLA
jgi:hypothetical protein